MRYVLFGAAAGAAIALVWLAAGAAIAAWMHRATQTPAGGEPPALPRSGDGSPLPGLPGPRIIPPPPATHPGTTTRIVVIYDCHSGGHCAWAWRPATSWQHASACAPIPTGEEIDAWITTVLEEGQ